MNRRKSELETPEDSIPLPLPEAIDIYQLFIINKSLWLVKSIMEYNIKIFSLVLLLTAFVNSAEQVAAGKGEELFTALVELEGLLTTQQSVIEVFESYLSKEEIRLREIRRRLVPYIETGRKSPAEVTGNPISAFLLLKGLTVDLDDLVNISEQKLNSDG